MMIRAHTLLTVTYFLLRMKHPKLTVSAVNRASLDSFKGGNLYPIPRKVCH